MLYSLKTVASAPHYSSYANAQDHSIRQQASAEHNTGSKQMEGRGKMRVEHLVVLGYCREDGRDLASFISTQQRARRCQRLPNAAHPTATPRRW
jgi:hypothetical protein